MQVNCGFAPDYKPFGDAYLGCTFELLHIHIYFWEFATDDYDIGFGLFFEWAGPLSDPEVKHNNHTASVNAEDGHSVVTKAENPEKSNILVDEIIPVSRQNSQNEVCCGSHLYPGAGTYVFKFDNSFSLWRSKTLYYRVCYTY
ncbi:unnamed protein product [Schistosoma curassoni]|uniref:GOLD domain-containing protein n=1 Tax=Schistosoma curassoni TaxID=6186 RepID=A0A183JL45_9TREM|nr:unnamed protein product [Schistosoma curassoni]